MSEPAGRGDRYHFWCGSGWVLCLAEGVGMKSNASWVMVK